VVVKDATVGVVEKVGLPTPGAITVVAIDIVTAALLARARPFRVPPASVIAVTARILPAQFPPVWAVNTAELPTTQTTFAAVAPLIRLNVVVPVSTFKADVTWKTNTGFERPAPSRVMTPPVKCRVLVALPTKPGPPLYPVGVAVKVVVA
jgi:hypothetical protein